MQGGLTPEDEKKARAARAAVEEVKSGQILGLGTGSTSRFAVMEIGERYRAGILRDIVGVPTSEATRALAAGYGIPLDPVERHASIDLAIDGADEVDPGLDLIKGLGGALRREKEVEVKARRFIVIVDDAKLVARLGTKAPVPIEVAPERWQALIEPLRALGGVPVLREDQSGPKKTDHANYIVDCRFPEGIADPAALARALDDIPLVLAHGLFLGMADRVIVADAGGLRFIDRPTPRPAGAPGTAGS